MGSFGVLGIRVQAAETSGGANWRTTEKPQLITSRARNAAKRKFTLSHLGQARGLSVRGRTSETAGSSQNSLAMQVEIKSKQA